MKKAMIYFSTENEKQYGAKVAEYTSFELILESQNMIRIFIFQLRANAYSA